VISTRVAVIGLAALATACGAANQRAVAYRDRARERFQDGKYALALADYRRAEELDEKKRLSGLTGERDRAAQEHVRALLREAWADLAGGDRDAARRRLLALRHTHWGVRGVEVQVDRSLADAAAHQLARADRLVADRHFVAALIAGERAVAPLAHDHVLRARLGAIRARGQAYHLARMRALARPYPAAAAFHYMLARRLGATTNSQGAGLVALVAGASASATRARDAATRQQMQQAEDEWIKLRASTGTWEASARTWLGNRYGVSDATALDEIWGASGSYPAPSSEPLETLVLPAPDDIAERVAGSSSVTVRPQSPSMEVAYQLSTSELASSKLATGLGGGLTIPRRKSASAYHLSGFARSDDLGGHVDGFGAEVLLTRRFHDRLALGIGIGYLDEHLVVAGGAPAVTQTSWHVPLVARVPLAAGFLASAELRPNILQLTATDPPPADEPGHYNSASLRVVGPVPLLGELSRALRALAIEGRVNYTRGAPGEELTYGGQISYRRSLGGATKDRGDLWDKVEDSPFAFGTLVGPALDFSFALGTSPLRDDAVAGGIGVTARFPLDRSKSVYQFGFTSQSGAMGAVSGWGLEYAVLKPVSKLGLIGIGIGYARSSLEEPVGDPNLISETSLYSPLVFRFPVAAEAILGIEARLNYLQLGGSNTDEPIAEARHFTPLTARLWLPLPLLGEAISLFRKFHLEGNISYVPGAPRELAYGAAVVWRAVDKRTFK
jgi:hypothetical protein